MIAEYVRVLERESESLVHALDPNPLLGSIISGDADTAYPRFFAAASG
jgi:hypothetical protein